MGKSNSKFENTPRANPHSITQSMFASHFKVPVSAELPWAAANRPQKFRKLMRKRFRQKIIDAGLYSPTTQDSPHYHSITVFDWDDTLLSTTYLDSRNDAFGIQSSMVNKQLAELDMIVSQLLKSALAVSKTYIITNALNGWVQFSAKIWLPRVSQLLERIEVVSARSTYEQLEPGNPQAWKTQAFLQALELYSHDALVNFISVGDSEPELVAAGAVKQYGICRKYTLGFTKTVKMQQCPTPEELCKQLLLVLRKFHRIYISPRHLTVKLTAKDSQETSRDP